MRHKKPKLSNVLISRRKNNIYIINMIKWFKLRPDSGEMMDDLDVIRR